MNVRPLVVAVVLTVGLIALYWRQSRGEPAKVSGYVEAHEIRVGSRVGGRVLKIHVEEGATVPANNVLVELEPYDLKQKLAEAKAQAAALHAMASKLKTGFRIEEKAAAQAKRDEAEALFQQAVAGPRPQEIREAVEAGALAQAEFELADQRFKRSDALINKGSTSREEHDKATSELKVAKASLAERKARLEMMQEGTRKEEIAQAKAKLAAADADNSRMKNGYRQEEITEAEARADAADAAVAAVEKQIAELAISSPTDVVVEAVEIQPGDLIGANQPVLSLMDMKSMWIRAYVPERRLGKDKEGKVVTIIFDSFPGKKYKGRVSFISRQAEFSPSNVQTPDDRSKQVYRVKVEVVDEVAGLRPGMAADIYLDPAEAP